MPESQSPARQNPRPGWGLGGLTCRGPPHSVLLPRGTLFAAGMSEDEAAQAPRPSSWEQDQQVRGQAWHGARKGGGLPPLALSAFWTAEGADISAPLTHFPAGRVRPGQGSGSPSTPGRLTWPLPSLPLCHPSWPLNNDNGGRNHSISSLSVAVPTASHTWATRIPWKPTGRTGKRRHQAAHSLAQAHAAWRRRPRLRPRPAARFFQNLLRCVCF